MTRILMVCLGNICRSPLAHGILKSQLPADSFYVDSAGTADYHIGKPPDLRSIQVAKTNGIDISTQSARQFKIADFDRFEYIYAMDLSNHSNIINLAKTIDHRAKVKLFLEANTTVTNKNVPDPYYGALSDFEAVYQLVQETCQILSDDLLC